MSAPQKQVPQTRLLTSREYAEALDLSESSVKRWTDEGRIQATRTPGGHRRIGVVEAIRFAREERLPIVRPAILGLAAAHLPAAGDRVKQFLESLEAGDQEGFEGTLLAAFLEGESVAQIGDRYLAPAFARIGEAWLHSEDGIMVEHRAVEIALGGLRGLKALLPEAPAHGRLAVGGAPEGDVYMIPSLLVSMVFQECGIRAINLGANLPIRSLESALRTHNPAMVWISFRSELRPVGFDAALTALVVRPEELARSYYLGGPSLGESLRQIPASNVATLDSLLDLHARLKAETP